MKVSFSVRSHLAFAFGLLSLCVTLLTGLAINYYVDYQFSRYAEGRGTEELQTFAQLLNDSSDKNLIISQANQQGLEISAAGNPAKTGQPYHGNAIHLNDGTILHLRNASKLGTLEQQLKDSINRSILVIGSISFIIALLIGILLSHRFSRPIRNITEATKEIAKGNYGIEAQEHSSISELQDLDTAVSTMSRQLKQNMEHDKRMTQDIQHELRTPITNLQAQTEAMLDGIWAKDEQHLQLCHKEIERLADIVGQLQELGQIEDGIEKAERQQTDMASLVTTLIDEAHLRLEAQRMKALNDIPKGTKIFCDSRMINTALTNLLSNAIRYSGKDTTVTFSIDYIDSPMSREQQETFERHGFSKSATLQDFAILNVADNGIGIPKENLAYLTERFYRVDKSRSRQLGGSGLGLSIVEAIAVSHGGFLDIASETGKGSRFSLFIRL
ncbi:MAG: ATP-binding protein [Spirochaetia bacterium]|nr:ATP-binding protein [Spirochaetia bacterium]